MKYNTMSKAFHLMIIAALILAVFCLSACGTVIGFSNDLKNMATGMASNFDEPSRLKVDRNDRP